MSPGCATFEVPHPPRWKSFLVGLALNAACVLLLAITNPHVFRLDTQFAKGDDHHVTLVAPTPLPQLEVKHRALVTPPAQPARTETVDVVTPPAVTKPLPINRSTTQPPSDLPEVPARVPTPRPTPEKAIKTDVFSTARSQSATLRQPERQVQTGGFGDPNGVSDQNAFNRQRLTVARLGTFDAPSGAGRGNGMGDSHGTSATIRSAGFGDQDSSQPAAEGKRTVQTGGFGEVVPKATPVSAQVVQSKSVLQPVEILYKPRPAYTPEALRQKVEGEVLLEVVFAASGSLRINRVVKGLGYGLDDMALAAAQRIQFHPARRDGQPYDCAALVHIVFELSR